MIQRILKVAYKITINRKYLKFIKIKEKITKKSLLNLNKNPLATAGFVLMQQSH